MSCDFSPKVSVIVPVYNCEKYISKCVNSLLNQTYENYEVIIINDGSKDKTLELINNICSNQQIITCYSQENQGPSQARNNGIEKAMGDYIMFVDADDNIMENYIEKLLENAVKFESDILSCGYIDISKYGIYHLNDFYKENNILDKDEYIKSIFYGVGGTLWGKIFKKEIIKKNKIKLDKDISMCEDMLFVLEYCMKANRFAAIDECLYEYNRLNEDSISANINFSYYDKMIEVLKKIEVILKDNNFKQKDIDSVLCQRIKNLTISFSIMQHNRVNNYSHMNKMDNLHRMFKNEYFNRYNKNFYNKCKKEKILILFMKKRIKILMNLYTFVLYKFQIFKNRIRGI